MVGTDSPAELLSCNCGGQAPPEERLWFPESGRQASKSLSWENSRDPANS